MSYRNPKRIVDKRFDVMLKGASQITNTMMQGVQQITNNVIKQKEQVRKQQELVDNEMQSMYSMANKFGTSGDPLLDNNLVSFWNGKVDEYFDVKNRMQSGEISRQEGNMALSKIKGLVPKFQTMFGYIAQETASYGENLKNNNVSSTGSMQNKDMLGTFMQGGDIQIAERGGNIYFFKPNDAVKGEAEFSLSEDMKTGNASMLNGDELIAMANQGKSLFNQKADISQLTTTLAEKISNPDGPSPYFETIKLRAGSQDPFNPDRTIENIPEGMEYEYQTMIPEQREQLLLDMENSPMTQTIMSDDKRMLSVFQDDIPDNAEASNGNGMSIQEISARLIEDSGLTEQEWLSSMGLTSMNELENSSWHEAPANLSLEQKTALSNTQDQIAKKFIALKAFNDNIDSDGIGKLLTKNKIITEPTDSESAGSEVVDFDKGFSAATIYSPNDIKTYKALMKDEEFLDKEIKDITNRVDSGEEVDFDAERKRLAQLQGYGSIGDDDNYGFVSTAGQLLTAIREIKKMDQEYLDFKSKYSQYQNKSNNNKPTLY